MKNAPSNNEASSGTSALNAGLAVATPWRCFHCDETFADAAEAALHFGSRIYSDPACRVDAAHLRELEQQLDGYRKEDTDLHRQIYAMECRHQQAVMRAEEAGYARGLRDAMADGLVTPNAKSQATDAALSRQVACTDGLGVAVSPAPSFWKEG